MKKVLPQNLRAFISHFLKPYKGATLLYVCIAFLTGCWAPFHSILLKYIINALNSPTLASLTQMSNLPSLTWPIVLLVLNYIVFDNITWRALGYLDYKFQPIIKNNIIHEMFSSILGSSHQFFNDRLSCSFSSQINTLADSIEIILHRISSDLIRSFSLLVVTLISMYSINPTFFYILVLWALLFILIRLYLSKYLIKLSKEQASAESIVSGQLVDCIANASNVRIITRREHEVSGLKVFLLNTKNKFQKKQNFLLWLQIFQGMSIALMFSFMSYFLIIFYRSNLISVGDFTLNLMLIMHVGSNSWSTSKELDKLNLEVGKCKHVLSSLIVAQAINDKKDATNLVTSKGKLSSSDVKFHDNDTEALFQEKSVTMKKDQKIELIGYYDGDNKSELPRIYK